jgi:hypothetical protein
VGSEGAARELVRQLVTWNAALHRIVRSHQAASKWHAVDAQARRPPPPVAAAPKRKGPPRPPPYRRRRRADHWRGLYSRNVED